jgi:hypothetical protein
MMLAALGIRHGRAVGDKMRLFFGYVITVGLCLLASPTLAVERSTPAQPPPPVDPDAVAARRNLADQPSRPADPDAAAAQEKAVKAARSQCKAMREAVPGFASLLGRIEPDNGVISEAASNDESVVTDDDRKVLADLALARADCEGRLKAAGRLSSADAIYRMAIDQLYQDLYDRRLTIREFHKARAAAFVEYLNAGARRPRPPVVLTSAPFDATQAETCQAKALERLPAQRYEFERASFTYGDAGPKGDLRVVIVFRAEHAPRNGLVLCTYLPGRSEPQVSIVRYLR